MVSPRGTTLGVRSRRELLAACVGLVTSRFAAVRAVEAGHMVVSTQGGDYARLLNEIIDTRLVRPTGIDVIQDIGDEPARAAKLYAARDLVRGVIDVSSNSAAVSYKLEEAGVLEPLSADNVPNLVHILQELRAPSMAAQFYSPQVLVYNPKAVPVPPGSFADLLDPRYRGKIGFPSG